MHPFALLAKEAVENYIREGKILSLPDDLPKELFQKRAGVFVTIKKDGQLRGCIGTYLPTKENLAKEIVANALSAATEDYRFGPLQKEELPYLSYLVYILSRPKLVKDLKQLDPKKYGIIVKTQGFSSPSDVIFDPSPRVYQKTGLLLPDLEGIETSEEQIALACQKGGINPRKEKILIYRFEVKKYE